MNGPSTSTSHILRVSRVQARHAASLAAQERLSYVSGGGARGVIALIASMRAIEVLPIRDFGAQRLAFASSVGVRVRSS